MNHTAKLSSIGVECHTRNLCSEAYVPLSDLCHRFKGIKNTTLTIASVKVKDLPYVLNFVMFFFFFSFCVKTL